MEKDLTGAHVILPDLKYSIPDTTNKFEWHIFAVTKHSKMIGLHLTPVLVEIKTR